MSEVACRGIRGAITVEGDVGDAVRELLTAIVDANACEPSDIAAITFTVTDDLPEAGPAREARALGWDAVPMLVVREHGGAADVPRCIRVLLLWNTERAQHEIRHIYLREAARLRPDLLRTDIGGSA